MSTEKVLSYVGIENIAGDLSEDKLRKIADDVILRAQQDLYSMKEWKECVDKGIELCKPEFAPKDTPWEGAANYKATILAEAANNFGNRAAVELMRDPKLVKASIIGLPTIKNVIDKKASEVQKWKAEAEGIAQKLQQLDPSDPQVAEMQKVIQAITDKITGNTDKIKAKKDDMRRKNERADRISELMNWQINVQMDEWRSDQKRLMYSLPNVGTCFKKTYYDGTLGRSVSKVISYPNFIINQRTQDIKSCRSFTDILAFTKAEADLRIKSGVWLNKPLFENTAELDAGSDEAAGAENTEDNADKFYEQYCWLDLDGDGIEEPYIVTVHVSSSTVLRIVARYDEDTIIVKTNDIKPQSLIKAQRKKAALIESENKEYGSNTPLPDPEDVSEYELVRIDPVKIITKYGMIPSSDGSYLDVGFYHLIGSMTMATNKTTNDLLNAGTLANTQSGLLAKGFRSKSGDLTITPGKYIQTEAPPEQLQLSIMPLRFGEPSQGLYALNEKLESQARSFAGGADMANQLQANTAPTTALAMIQEALIPHTAHMSMIVDSMSQEFDALYQLNRAHLDADDYKSVVGDDEAVFTDDFDTDGMSVYCGANPEMSSRMQRMTLAQAELEQVPLVIQAGGNAVPIVKNYYKQIGSANLDEIFPNESEMSPEEKAQMQAMRQQQEQANAMAEQQLKLTQLQTDLLEAGEERKAFEASIAAKETLAKIDKMFKEMEQIEANIKLTLEKAESEDVNNKISTYTLLHEVTAKNAELDMAREESEKQAEQALGVSKPEQPEGDMNENS